MPSADEKNKNNTRFRHRKISVKQQLHIYRPTDLKNLDEVELQQRDIIDVETGVEKNEEKEVHLHKILTKKLAITAKKDYIPTPDASHKWNEYDDFYKNAYTYPNSYIKFSAKVEDCLGANYFMDELDNEFLIKFNKEQNNEDEKINEDEFEILCFSFEKIIKERQPFLSMDPETILSFDELKPSLLKFDFDNLELKKKLAEEIDCKNPIKTVFDPIYEKQPRPYKDLIEKFGSKIYDHWKIRKIDAEGNQIFPQLRFERPDEKDDSHPYICFRRRDVRQPRKTRRIDVLNSQKLRLVLKSLQNAKELALLVAKRENINLNLLKNDQNIFNQRCEVKKLKRTHNINDNDDDLINHKRKRFTIMTTQKRKQLLEKQKEEQKKLELKRASQEAAEESSLNKKKNKSKKDLVKVGKKSNNEKFNKENNNNNNNQPQTVTSNVYVKLPSSKIPDIILDDVENLLLNKERNARKFVHDRMEKRRKEDKNFFFNLTDNPYNPVFDIDIPKNILTSNIPYSSITSSKFEVPRAYYTPDLQNYLNGKSDGVSVFNNKGEKIENSSNNYKIKKPEIFNPFDLDANSIYRKNVITKEYPIKFRSRINRCGMKFIDRKPNVTSSEFDPHSTSKLLNEFFDFEAIEKQETDPSSVINVYDSKWDELVRRNDQWKFDTPINEYGTKFSSEPSILNQISDETQTIRFGTMLGSKAYEQLRDVTIKYRQEYINKLRQQKIQAKKQKLAAIAAANANNNNNNNNNNATNNVNSNSTPSNVVNKVSKGISNNNSSDKHTSATTPNTNKVPTNSVTSPGNNSITSNGPPNNIKNKTEN